MLARLNNIMTEGGEGLSAGPAMYVLRCRDGSLYAGWTADLAKRLRDHGGKRGAKYVRSRRPFQLLAWWPAESATQARRLEAAFKALGRAQKLAILEGSLDWNGGMRRMHTAPEGDELAALKEEARKSRARISTPKGDMTFTFFVDEAPQHSAAFVKLAKAGFYDGLTFHRVEPGFVIQGGDPQGDGTGGPGYRLDGEFNDRPHLRGTVAMARSSNPNSAGSQFYICLDDARFLDKQYTVFGQLQEGFEVLDAIKRGDKMDRVTVEPK